MSNVSGQSPVNTPAGRPKYKHSHFTPSDDQRLKRCESFEELQEAIRSVASETRYSLQAVKRHTLKLGIWNRLAPTRKTTTITDKGYVVNALTRSNTHGDLLSVVAARFDIERAAARKRLYNDDEYVEFLNRGTYSVREASHGLCMSRKTIRRLITEGVLKAKRLQSSGKLRISSESIFELARRHPRQINWQKCLQRSPWLQDVLETERIQEIAALLCVKPKSVRAWLERGVLKLPFHPDRISDYFADGLIYRFLDEYPGLVDLVECAKRNPEWFQRYERVKSRYPRKVSLPAGASS